MNTSLDAILERVSKQENSLRYNALMNHPSDVVGGNNFIENYNTAAKLLGECLDPQNTAILLPKYRLLVKKLNEWLDEQKWA